MWLVEGGGGLGNSVMGDFLFGGEGWKLGASPAGISVSSLYFSTLLFACLGALSSRSLVSSEKINYAIFMLYVLI